MAQGIMQKVFLLPFGDMVQGGQFDDGVHHHRRAGETRTGIDFFCNLPDDIENKVEVEYDSSWWQQ